MWGNAAVMLVGIVEIPFSLLQRATSPMALETPCPIPMRLDRRQPASGLLLALGPEGQAIPREAGPWVNASLPGEGAWCWDTAPGERKRLRWSCGLRLCWGGSRHVSPAWPRKKFLILSLLFLSLSLSPPSQVAEFETNNRSYFPVVPLLSLPRWHVAAAAAGGDYGCAGWEQPPPVLHPGVPSPGTPSGVGTARVSDPRNRS